MTSPCQIPDNQYNHLYALLETDFSCHLTSQALPSMWYCSEKSILAKQINDSIYIQVGFIFKICTLTPKQIYNCYS